MEEAPSSSSADSLAFSLGIDVGKEALEVALRGDEEAIARTTVANDSDGHDELLRWLQDQGSGPEETSVCMEASGDFEKAAGSVEAYLAKYTDGEVAEALKKSDTELRFRDYSWKINAQ